MTDVTVSPFAGPTPGPAIPVSCNPLELFPAFFDDTLIGLIVTETNRYAKLCLESQGKQASWCSTEEEILAYLGFHILMGLNHKPEIRDYWSRDEFLHYAPIASRISRDRFEEISHYLHFVSNDTLPKRGKPGYHRLQKIMPVLMHLKQKFLAAYNPHQHNAVDEAMIPFKGTQHLCRSWCVRRKNVYKPNVRVLKQFKYEQNNHTYYY